MISIKKALPLITIVISILMFLQQYMFSLRIPLSAYTPIVGIVGIFLALQIEKGNFRTWILIINTIITFLFPLYIILTFIFPNLFV